MSVPAVLETELSYLSLSTYENFLFGKPHCFPHMGVKSFKKNIEINSIK